MSTALFIRPLARVARAASRANTFHSSARAFVKAGDELPSVELVEKSPGNKVNLRELVNGKKALIIGVPAAFSTLSNVADVVKGHMMVIDISDL